MKGRFLSEVPETRYATAPDGLRLAYQQWGEGPPLLIVPPFVTNIELEWEYELVRRTRERLGRGMTCVQFEKRGMGLSDRFAQPRERCTRAVDPFEDGNDVLDGKITSRDCSDRVVGEAVEQPVGLGLEISIIEGADPSEESGASARSPQTVDSRCWPSSR